MQIRVIKHIRKVYACRDCETAPVTAGKSAQLIGKKHDQSQRFGNATADKIRRWLATAPFRKNPRSPRRRYPTTNPGTLGNPARCIAQPDARSVAGSYVIQCDETGVQVMKEPDQEPTSQS